MTRILKSHPPYSGAPSLMGTTHKCRMMGKPFWLKLFYGKVRRVYFLEMGMNEIDARKFAFEFVLEGDGKAEEAFSKAKALSDFLIHGAVPKLKKDTHSDDGTN